VSEKKDFENLTPLYPEGRILLENDTTKSLEARAVDLLCATRSRTARFDRVAAASWQNDFAEGDRQGDSS